MGEKKVQGKQVTQSPALAQTALCQVTDEMPSEERWYDSKDRLESQLPADALLY